MSAEFSLFLLEFTQNLEQSAQRKDSKALNCQEKKTRLAYVEAKLIFA